MWSIYSVATAGTRIYSLNKSNDRPTSNRSRIFGKCIRSDCPYMKISFEIVKKWKILKLRINPWKRKTNSAYVIGYCNYTSSVIFFSFEWWPLKCYQVEQRFKASWNIYYRKLCTTFWLKSVFLLLFNTRLCVVRRL